MGGLATTIKEGFWNNLVNIIMCILTAVYIFFGEILIYTLADQHALGDTKSHLILTIFYYLIALILIFLSAKMIHSKMRNEKELVLDFMIYAVLIALAYTAASIVIDNHVVHFV